MRSDMRERRRFLRIPEDLPISYEVLSGGMGTREFLIKEVSQGGIRFFVHKFVTEGSLLKIRLPLQKIFFNFEAIVKVAWIKREAHKERCEVGAEFINITEESQKHLIDFIKSILKQKLKETK